MLAKAAILVLIGLYHMCIHFDDIFKHFDAYSISIK